MVIVPLPFSPSSINAAAGILSSCVVFAVRNLTDQGKIIQCSKSIDDVSLLFASQFMEKYFIAEGVPRGAECGAQRLIKTRHLAGGPPFGAA